MRRIILVGPSGSGKTSLAHELSRLINLPVVSMDDFRAKSYLHGQFPQVGRIRNYEHPDCWDPVAISSKLRTMSRRGEGWIAEGNHLLHYPAVAELESERYYLDVSFEVSLERRKSRHRFSPADESFVAIGREQTQLWVAPQKLLPGVVTFDGRRTTEWLANQILWVAGETVR